MAYIKVEDCNKKFIVGENEIIANNNINFEMEQGELVVVLGSSGAGKSTLLNILGGMDSPTSGKVTIDGMCISDFNRKELTLYRRCDVGFVFQFYNLISNLTAIENVQLSSDLVEDSLDSEEALGLVGLEHRINNFPSQLSGGEQQRVSIARAIAKKPKILLCDEPTGALDYKTGKQVLQILQDMCVKQNGTVIIVTHNAALAQMANRVIHMHDATVKDITINVAPKPIAEIEW